MLEKDVSLFGAYWYFELDGAKFRSYEQWSREVSRRLSSMDVEAMRSQDGHEPWWSCTPLIWSVSWSSGWRHVSVGGVMRFF